MKAVLKKAVSAFLGIPRVRWMAEEMIGRELVLDPGVYLSRGWEQLEPVFTEVRRKLRLDPQWRFGPARVHEVASETWKAFAEVRDPRGLDYCDMGAGHHPYSTSAVMLLNGVASTLSLDITEAPSRRAAEALCDLLVDALVQPARWNWCGDSEDVFISRVRRFDLASLQEGNLKAGLDSLPIAYRVSDINESSLEAGSFDLLSSRAVLEHFMDFDQAVHRLFSIMKPGGLAYHLVDLVDHRHYHHPDRYHFWSFLAEDEGYQDKDCNRLRACELRNRFENAGFEILRYEPRAGAEMPAGFLDRLRGRFADMPAEELRYTSVRFLLRKP